jgi:tripartite motif-containing protein 71
VLLVRTPCAVAVDGSGNVYVADHGNDRIQAFTSSGTYLTQWGTFGYGEGEFYGPYGVAVGAGGHIYVLEEGGSRIQVFSTMGPTPTKSTTWGRIKTLYR